MNDDSNLPAPSSIEDGAGPSADVLDVVPETTDAGQPAQRPRRRRRILLWTLIPLGLVLLVAAGIGGFYAWSETQFALLERDGAVQVQQGVGPFAAYERADVDLALLPADTRTELAAHVTVADRKAAAVKIAELREGAATCETTLIAPCPLRPLKTPRLRLSTNPFPKRDHVRIAWTQVDGRDGVVVKLKVNGKRPPKPCPEVLEQAGDCVFDGDFVKEYRVTVVTTGPKGTAPIVSESSAITEKRPQISISKGSKWTGKSDTGPTGTFCRIQVHADGLADSKTYQATVYLSGHKPVKRSFSTDAAGSFDGVFYSYADPSRGSWVQVQAAGLETKRLTWECGTWNHG